MGEFRNAVRSLKGRNLNSNGHLRRANGSALVTREASQFMDIARSIGKDITSTYTKLEKLTLLAKRKTIFDDKPVEIQELTYIIKQDIAHLNKQIGQLQTLPSPCWSFQRPWRSTQRRTPLTWSPS